MIVSQYRWIVATCKRMKRYLFDTSDTVKKGYSWQNQFIIKRTLLETTESYLDQIEIQEITRRRNINFLI